MPWSQRWSPLLVVLAAASGLHFSACTPAGKVTSSTTPTYKPDYVAGGNRWSFKAYDNSDPDHTTLVSAQVLCFEYAGTAGNHIKYTWYSETFPGWSGSAIQEGDEIFLHGDYANGVGHSSMQLETLVATTPPNVNGSAGSWQEWRTDGANGTTISFANTRSLREGNCTLTARQFAKQAPLLVGDPVITDVP